MKSESQFNTWLRKQFYENSNKKVCVQRIENTTGNGTFDILVIVPSKTLFIECKYQTEKLRPEQYAFQIKANGIIKQEGTDFFSLCAFPKRKEFVMNKYDPSSINEDGITPCLTKTYALTPDGFSQFYQEL
jgi:hypothetical protein